MERIGAAVWATGRAGRVIVEAGLTRPWLEFRGGIVYNPAKEGLDLGEACGLDVRVGATGFGRRGRGAGPARTSTSCSTRASGRRPRSPRRACARTGPARMRSRSPGSSIRATILGADAAAELDAASRAAGQRILGTGLLGLPDDHPAAGLAVERADLRRDPAGAGRRHVAAGATASCATRASAGRSRPPAAGS